MMAEGRGKTGQRVKKGQVVARLSGAALRENILHCRAKLEKAFLRYAGVAASTLYIGIEGMVVSE